MMGRMAIVTDILVVGLGAVGSAALYQGAKTGARCIGIDRFSPPHEQGSSHGETRITRQAIGEGREFVPLVLRSDEIWQELESASGATLVTRNGCLVLAAPAMAGSHHGSNSFLQDTVEAAKAFAIPHEFLGEDEVRRRFSQFAILEGEAAYFEPGAGFLRPEDCIATNLQLAKQFGAQIQTNEWVTEIRRVQGGVAVQTSRANYVAAKVIVSAGPWISQFLPATIQQNFLVYRQTLCWFSIDQNADRYAPKHFPVFIWLTGQREQDMLYGFPAVSGRAGGVKIATENYETTVDPDAVSREVSERSIRELQEEHVAVRFPDLGSHCLRTATCLYTVTPDAKFVIDQADENVWFASACSGHGFKHSPAVGEALAQLALGQSTQLDLAPFALRRLIQR